MPTRRSLRSPILLIVLLAGGCRWPAPPEPTDGPRLILVVVVDQMRYDYLTGFDTLFDGGLRYLLDNGVSFSDAHHFHADTVTAPGHATISTGRHPSHHGIVGNGLWDREQRVEVAAVEDTRYGVSPRRLIGNGLGAWVKERSPRSKVYSVAGKDKSAVFLGGHEPDAAYWYDRRNGGFRSSRYYMRKLPDWVNDFNAEAHLDALYGRSWEPRPVPLETLGALGIERHHALGPLVEDFPHTFGGESGRPDWEFYEDLRSAPFYDAQVGRFAQRIIEQESLGADGWVDLLTVGFSALDGAGHDFGPGSREVLDVLLGVDRTLGELLQFVHRRIGRDRLIVVLSSDHGAMTPPERRVRRHLPGRRMGQQEFLCFQRLPRSVRAVLGDGDWFTDYLVLNQELLEERKLDRSQVERTVADLIEDCPSVARVWTRSELMDGARRGDPLWLFHRHSFHAERSRDFSVQFEEFFLPSRSTAATHGTTYPYDTHVPLVFAIPETTARTVSRRVHTVDIAPTLAALVGIEVLAEVDGVDLSQAFELAEPATVLAPPLRQSEVAGERSEPGVVSRSLDRRP